VALLGPKNSGIKRQGQGYFCFAIIVQLILPESVVASDPMSDAPEPEATMADAAPPAELGDPPTTDPPDGPADGPPPPADEPPMDRIAMIKAKMRAVRFVSE
jgi:hypothetical protein